MEIGGPIKIWLNGEVVHQNSVDRIHTVSKILLGLNAIEVVLVMTPAQVKVVRAIPW